MVKYRVFSKAGREIGKRLKKLTPKQIRGARARGFVVVKFKRK